MKPTYTNYRTLADDDVVERLIIHPVELAGSFDCVVADGNTLCVTMSKGNDLPFKATEGDHPDGKRQATIFKSDDVSYVGYEPVAGFVAD